MRKWKKQWYVTRSWAREKEKRRSWSYFCLAKKSVLFQCVSFVFNRNITAERIRWPFSRDDEQIGPRPSFAWIRPWWFISILECLQLPPVIDEQTWSRPRPTLIKQKVSFLCSSNARMSERTSFYWKFSDTEEEKQQQRLSLTRREVFETTWRCVHQMNTDNRR